MKKQIKLPSADLGYLNQVNIELEMRAKHYDALTTSSGDHHEEVVLSILKDLMEEDPYKLTTIDLMYLFTLVKISSIGSVLHVTTRCPQIVATPNGNTRVCGAKYAFNFSLAKDNDVIYRDPSTPAPKFTLTVNGTPEEFSIKLPTMATEIELLNTLDAEGKSRKEVLLKDRPAAMRYSRARMAAHFVSNNHTQEEIVKAIEDMSYREMSELTALIKSVNSYGLRQKVFTCTCKECGGVFDYRLPLFFGISM